MRPTRREFLAMSGGSAAGLILSGCIHLPFLNADRGRNLEYERLADEFHESMSDPLRLADREDFSRAGEMPNVSRDEIERIAAQRVLLADKIRDSHCGDLTLDQKLDLEIAENWLRVMALESTALVDGTPRHAVCPDAVTYLSSLTPTLLERDPRSKGYIIYDFITRSFLMKEYLEQTLARMDRPVGIWVKTELDAASGFDGLAESVRKFATEAGYAYMVTLDEALESARTAVADYTKRLGAMPTRNTLSLGEKATREIFRLKGIDIELPELHRLAVEYLRKNMGELEKVRPELIAKHDLDPSLDVLGVAGALKVKFASPEGGVVDLANRLLGKAEAFAYESGLIRKIENQSAKVERVPDYLKPLVPLIGILQPGIFCKGERRGTVYINEFPGIEKALTRLNLPAIICHELFPGHHCQFTRATENHSKIRAWVNPQDLTDGWAVYVAEQIMAGEMGFVGDSELRAEEHYMAKVDQLRIGARVCFVLACMTGDRKYFNNDLGVKVTSPNIIDASTEFYKGVTGFAEARARGEVELLSSTSTYGALYLVGSSMLRDMETQGRKKHGSSFSRPKFLEAVLQEGMLPVSYIKRSLEHKGVI